MLKDLLKGIAKGEGILCADSAYLSRRNCNLIAKKGRVPYIKPKKNSRVKAKGSQAWRSMIKLFKEDEDAFKKRYHRRSLVESVYSVLKTVFGNHLSSRRRKIQRRELMCRILAYNIDRINLIAIQEDMAK
jgi:transposase